MLEVIQLKWKHQSTLPHSIKVTARSILYGCIAACDHVSCDHYTQDARFHVLCASI